MRKKAITGKERSSQWNKEIKTIRKFETKLGQKYYFLDNDAVGYSRHELLKVCVYIYIRIVSDQQLEYGLISFCELLFNFHILSGVRTWDAVRISRDAVRIFVDAVRI